MAKEKNPSMIPQSRERITITHLQRMKNEGKLITMVGTGPCDAFWVLACERAGVEFVRYTCFGGDSEERANNIYSQTRAIRALAPNICLNAVMQPQTYASKENAVYVASRIMNEGADSVLCLGITNETLKYMADHYIPVFGHAGMIPTWYTEWWGGYSRVGKTAEDAMRVFRQAYEYQENGMVGMTIEMTPRELTDIVAKKLRVPVISIAGGAVADGSELVIYDILGFQPVATMPKHSQNYRQFLEEGIKAFAEFNADVKNKKYPQPHHGWSMDERELDKFMNELEKKYPDVR